ncbi:bZIP transcription factor (Fcr3) [Purpureocillium lavendulum]|uniref:BZIP transcription factor (Fcr3) n=1 Tax=Purpureocillium lavendulum TaxID=1247861 RepID=A0AB34FY16_9HYPO|nr:bZIP transcription factor (Fcr3) [Purpureocillium lavendulum]
MDFTGQYAFASSQPYPSFAPIPPLTPAQSGPSDDYSHTSPQDPFDTIPAPEPFHAFDIPNGFGATAHHSFAGPPTPPNHHGVNPGYPQQQQQHMGHHRQPTLSRSDSSNGTMPGPKSDNGADDSNPARGASEDDDNLTPAQSRRKAQNRAAQRAFRERKERHVKDLEAKLATLEAAQQEASVENERLKRDLQKMSTENEILRATSSMGHGNQGSHSPEPMTTAPMRYSPTDFYSNVLQNHQNKSPSHRITTSDKGERLLAAGATWDYIVSHDLFKRGLVDVGRVSELLKDCARCDGQGPVFAESDILSAVEQSVASGSDDLL